MTHVLIIDDDPELAEGTREEIEAFTNGDSDIALDSAQARELVTRSIQAGRPYDLFLIDLILGYDTRPEFDGIQVMQELQKISPDTDAVVFTGQDAERGVQAIQAGAIWYLIRPHYSRRELEFLFVSVNERHRSRQEHDWEKIIRETTELALEKLDFESAAEYIVKNAIGFGFERAHLFWLPIHKRSRNDKGYLGIASAGDNCIPDFAGSFYPLEDWFDLEKPDLRKIGLSAQAIASDRSGKAALGAGYQAPRMDAILLQLTRGEAFAGVLLLDYDQLERTAGQQEKLLLNIFAHQVSLLLTQAAAFRNEKRMQKVDDTKNSISRKITNATAAGELGAAMEEIHHQIGEVMDVSNLSIVLSSRENGQLEYPLTYFKGKQAKRPRPPASPGLIEHFLATQRDALLIEDVQGYAQANHIQLDDPVPACWLAAPLKTADRTIGAIVVYQMDAQAEPYQKDDRDLLKDVADQIAGAIQSNRMAEAERADAKRMQVLQQASAEMLRIARENIRHFWFTLVTIATADFGLGFNRSLVFRYDKDKGEFQGETGVGTERTEEARRDWERDKRRLYGFENFLEDLKKNKLRHTPFEKLITRVRFTLPDRENALNAVIHGKERLILKETELEAKLPKEILDCFDLSTCAILPIRAGEETVGLMIVDNRHNGQPLKDALLDRLQTLLDIAGLVWEAVEQQEKSENLLRINKEIITGSQNQSLKTTLDRICETARRFSGADWAVIFPLLPDNREKFDRTNLGHDGELTRPLKEYFSAHAHVGMISSHILQQNEFTVEDLGKEEASLAHLHISEHKFLKSEKVEALIGVAVRHREDEDPLGLLYLDYRQPHKFTEEDKKYAHSFASLAGMAIFNRAEQVRHRMHLKTGVSIAKTVGTGLDLEKSMDAILSRLTEVFKNTRPCILLYYKNLYALKFAPASYKYYRIQNPDVPKDLNTFRLEGSSIACRVAKESLDRREPRIANVPNVDQDNSYLRLNTNTKSELCSSILDSEQNLRGVLVLERDTYNGFDKDDEDLVTTVSQQLGTVIERAQRSEDLEFKSVIAAKTAWAADMVHEYMREIDKIRSAAYLLGERVKNDPAIPKDLIPDIEWIDKSAHQLYEKIPRDDEAEQILEIDKALERILPATIKQRDIKLDWRPGAEGVHIRVNALDLKRIFNHLSRNTASNLPKSGRKRISVSTEPWHEGRVKIVFKDSGKGISNEKRLSIFHRRLSDKKDERGGYGLLIVRQLIEGMKGEIILEPYQPGEGAQFVILLPTVMASAQELE